MKSKEADMEKYSGRGIRLRRDIVRNKYIYLMILPVFAWYVIFHYIPMLG